VASHSDSCAAHFARRLQLRADELAPPATEAALLTAFANPPDPVGFCRRILGFMPWSRQREILEAVAEYMRVGCVSGHKVGKSTALAALALWFYCSYPGARVVITATTDNQVNGIIWREIRRLVRKARVAIPGGDKIALTAYTGLNDRSDFSEIRGYTAKEAEAIAGVSGEYILYLVDEASGVAPFIFQAIEGNRAGGNAWVFLISNPTRAEGEFYDAFHSKSRDADPVSGYFNIHIDSRESPNVTGEWRELDEYDRATDSWKLRTKPIPGLAVSSWVDEKRRDWGEDSALFKIRVAGSFAIAEEAKIFQAALLGEMQERWALTVAAGRLYIGVDPAGDGDGGDESGFASRRGFKTIELRARAGLNEAGHIAEVEDMIAAAYGSERPPVVPLVLVDSEGEVGWKVYVKMKEHAERTGRFEVARVRSSNKAIREPLIYDRIRDELYANARKWAREGGAIPENTKLEKDLHTPEYKSDIRGRLKATDKKELRKLLGRSPDVGDAWLLSVWEPLSARQAESAAAAQQQAPEHDSALPEALHDPYAGLRAWHS
jgi:phage terminase large subunit